MSPKSTVEAWTESGAQGGQFQNFFLDRYAAAYKHEMAHFADMLVRGAERKSATATVSPR